jgi:hypothetical protein
VGWAAASIWKWRRREQVRKYKQGVRICTFARIVSLIFSNGAICVGSRLGSGTDSRAMVTTPLAAVPGCDFPRLRIDSFLKWIWLYEFSNITRGSDTLSTGCRGEITYFCLLHQNLNYFV